jgi:hypothetical protein
MASASKRSRIAISLSIALAVLGVVGITAAAQGSSSTLGKFELRPEAGQEVDRDVPSTHSKSTAPRIVPAQASAVAASNPGAFGFTGVTFQDHRDADNGNQTSDTPPDQGLCAGSGEVIEPVNTTFSTYSSSGQLMSGPTSLTVFYTGQHEIDRGVDPPTFGPFLSDPKCYYDPVAKRFVMTILQLPFTPEGDFINGRSNILIAVSNGSHPSTSPGDWSFFALNTTDDGTPSNDGSGNTMPSQPGCPCFGDQPLLGADKYGIYLTTNEYSILGPEFNGAQVYALSKSALFSGSLKYQAFHGAPIPLAEGPAYSLQPAASPSAADWNTVNHGTEYLLSALDFDATTDNRIAAWALTNTASLDNPVPSVTMTAPAILASEPYGQPPNAQQKNGAVPLADAVGEREGLLATNDDRMNQVVYAAGKLWGAVNTAVRTTNGASSSTDRSGIAYFAVSPSTPSATTVAGTIAKQGYVALGNNDNAFFPSIAVNSAGKGVMTFSIAGQHYFPSAAYTTIDAVNGAGPVHIAGAGAGPNDDHATYEAFGGDGVSRWGDYSAAAASENGSIWIAAEYIPGGFGYAPYLSNWGTFVGNVAP